MVDRVDLVVAVADSAAREEVVSYIGRNDGCCVKEGPRTFLGESRRL